MGFVIHISKSEEQKVIPVNPELVVLCEGVVDQGDHFLYIPQVGKLFNVLKILGDHHITYELKANPPGKAGS